MAPYNFATAGLNPSTEGWLSAAPASHPAVDGGHPGVQLFHNVILHLSSEYWQWSMESAVHWAKAGSDKGFPLMGFQLDFPLI